PVGVRRIRAIADLDHPEQEPAGPFRVLGHQQLAQEQVGAVERPERRLQDALAEDPALVLVVTCGHVIAPVPLQLRFSTSWKAWGAVGARWATKISPTYSRPKVGSVEIRAAHGTGPSSRSPRRFSRVTRGAFRPQNRVEALTTPARDTPRSWASAWTRRGTSGGTSGPPCSDPSTSTRSPTEAWATVRLTSAHSAHSRRASTGRGRSGRR